MERLVFLILATVVTTARPYPQAILDTDRIYTLDDLNELRRAIAHEECLRTPGCDPYPQPHAQCQLGSGAVTMLRDLVSTRNNIRGCNSMAGRVLWPATNECVELLTQGPCPPGHWVQLSNPGSVPVCARQPCRPGEALLDGRVCHTTADSTVCPPTQQLLTNEFGEAECDCGPGLVYHLPTDTCYTPYTQGPCPPGEVIKVMDAEGSGQAACVVNPCPSPSMVPLEENCSVSTRMGPNTNCHVLDTQGPCVSGFLTIDESLSEPICLETHSIFNLPNTKLCPRGSKRDSIGRCRRNLGLTHGDLPPIVTSRPRPQKDGRLCPTGQVLVSGTCLQLAQSSKS